MSIDAHVLKGSGPGASVIVPADIAGLTLAGHDLLDTLRSNAVWEKTKQLTKEKGLELTFESLKALGKIALDYLIKASVA